MKIKIEKGHISQKILGKWAKGFRSVPHGRPDEKELSGISLTDRKAISEHLKHCKICSDTLGTLLYQISLKPKYREPEYRELLAS